MYIYIYIYIYIYLMLSLTSLSIFKQVIKHNILLAQCLNHLTASKTVNQGINNKSFLNNKTFILLSHWS